MPGGCSTPLQPSGGNDNDAGHDERLGHDEPPRERRPQQTRRETLVTHDGWTTAEAGSMLAEMAAVICEP